MIRRIAAALALFLVAGTAAAQYGSRPVTLIVGFPAGGSNDLAARIIAPKLAELLGTSVVVVNKPGANATIGTDFVAKASPDGHTLLVASASPLVIVPHTSSSIPYETLKDFVPITTLGVTPGAIGMNNAMPARNLKQLMDSAAGKDLRIASTGNGGMPHLTIELLKLGAKPGAVVHVPYKGAALAVTDVMGGHVEGIVADLASLITMFKDGKLRPLVVTGRNRVDFLPDVPTAIEQGYAGLVAENWLGVLAPARTPPAIIDKLYESLKTIMLQPQVREQMVKVGYSVTSSPAPAEFQQFLRDEFDKWGKVARDSGAKAD
jgi:tripartite-type tricarboxylate transporter receptor subunit TctC